MDVSTRPKKLQLNYTTTATKKILMNKKTKQKKHIKFKEKITTVYIIIYVEMCYSIYSRQKKNTTTDIHIW